MSSLPRDSVAIPEAQLLLEWYAKEGRSLPWRVRGAAHPDPYAVWVSEIMLQQTTVKTVCGYFQKWMERFPDLKTLAAASLEDVLLIWQGLGYYTRAKKMHQCAVKVVEEYGGVFPSEREKLLKLPGIGPYTASSLCAFGFNLPETVVDGNVIRVLARYYAIEGEVDRSVITPLAEKLTPADAGADYASAIMDLGATVCTPLQPLCGKCPWQKLCAACQKGVTDSIPLLKKNQKKKKTGAVFVLYSPEGKLFIRKRPGKGLLSGLWELPWEQEETFPFEGRWEKMSPRVRHIFTHIELDLNFFTTGDPLPENFLQEGRFVAENELAEYPFSTLMKKVLKKLFQAHSPAEIS